MKNQEHKLLDQVRDKIRLKHYPISGTIGHKDVSTTIIYSHVVKKGGRGVLSPFDKHRLKG